MKVSIFLLCYNEEILLPHTLTHYRKYFPSADFTIFDNNSTDKSVEIARSLGCNVFYFDTNSEIDDFKYLKIKNNCWKAVTEGWIIVCDMDEWLCINEEWLKKEDDLGTTIIYTNCYEIVGDSKEENLFDINPHSLCSGVRSPFFDKQICFKANEIKEMNYGMGCHSCAPEGNIKLGGPYLLKHMKMMGLPYALKQNRIRYERSSRMRSLGFAVHYSPDSDVILNFKSGWVTQNINIRHLCECFG